MKLTTTFISLCSLCLPAVSFADDGHAIIGKKAEQLPLFDAHMHWKRPAWSAYPTDKPLLKRIAALAQEKSIPMHVHANHQPIEYLYSLNPDLTIIWAQAGMNEPVEVVEKMMARYSTLYADTSYRETDILTINGAIDDQWRRVLERFADRFMVGTDTWINEQWEDYDSLIAVNRKWLAQLTTASAKQIAYQNAERLFGRKIGPHLFHTR